MVEMGVDPGLTDAAAKVSADGVRYLSRDEIARFGLETRGIYETPWMPYENFSNQFVVLKSVTQASEAGGKDYRTTNVRIWCTGGGVGLWFVYQREPSSDETGLPPVVRLAAGDSSYAQGRRTKAKAGGRREGRPGDHRRVRDRKRPGKGWKRATVCGRSWEFLRNAIAAPGIVITEAPAPRRARFIRVVTLSTGGLPKALSRCRRTAANPSLKSAPVKFLDAPGVGQR